MISLHPTSLGPQARTLMDLLFKLTSSGWFQKLQTVNFIYSVAKLADTLSAWQKQIKKWKQLLIPGKKQKAVQELFVGKIYLHSHNNENTEYGFDQNGNIVIILRG